MSIRPGNSEQLARMHAWVDESMRVDGSDGEYILAAAVADSTRAESTRAALRGLLKGRQPRIHWHTEDRRRRAHLAAAVAEFDLTSVIIIGSPLERARQERARRKCLQRLLHELDRASVAQVWTEARTDSLNQRDLHLVEALRGQGSISKRIRVDPARPADEPMLWAADILAGIVAGSRGGRGEWLVPLRSKMSLISIDVT